MDTRWFAAAAVVAICAMMSGCALAARAAAGVGARGALAAGVARGALAGAIGARTLGAAGVDVAAARTAATGLLRMPTALTASRATVVARGTGVIGTVEATSGSAVIVRGYGGGTALRALRQGTRVTYEVGGRTIGYSEMRGGAVHHYLSDGPGYRHLGYDVIRGNSVLQYAPDGALLVETSLRSIGSGGNALAASLAAFLGASSADADVVLAVQHDLAALGYYDGPVDGVLGYWTRKAIDDAIAEFEDERAATQKAKEDAIARQARVLHEVLRARSDSTPR